MTNNTELEITTNQDELELITKKITIDDYNDIVVDYDDGTEIHRIYWKENGDWEVGIGYEIEENDDSDEYEYKYTGKVFVYQRDDISHTFETYCKRATKDNLVDCINEFDDSDWIKCAAMYCGVIDSDYFDIVAAGDTGESILNYSGFSLEKEDDTKEKRFMFCCSPLQSNAFCYLKFRNEKELKAFARKFEPRHEKLTAREYVNHYVETMERCEPYQTQLIYNSGWIERENGKWFYDRVGGWYLQDNNKKHIKNETDLFVA